MDGFPKTRDHWAIMVESGVAPDSLIVLDDHRAPDNYLLSRFTQVHSISGEGDGIHESEPKNEVTAQNMEYVQTDGVCNESLVLNSVLSTL